MFECEFLKNPNTTRKVSPNTNKKPVNNKSDNIIFFQKLNYPWLDIKQFKLVKKSLETVECISITNKNSNSKTVLYSSPGFEQCFDNLAFLVDLSTSLKCNVVSYTYSNSLGNLSIKSITNDLEEVLLGIKSKFSIAVNDIILFGEGIGSYPSLTLAASSLEKFNREFFAVILLSAICLSTINQNKIEEFFAKDKTQSNNKLIREMSCFNSSEFINKINCPVLLIHGCKDNVSEIHEVKSYLKEFKKLYFWFPTSGKHLNIAKKYRSKFVMKTNYFLNYIFSSLVGESTNASSFLMKTHDNSGFLIEV